MECHAVLSNKLTHLQLAMMQEQEPQPNCRALTYMAAVAWHRKFDHLLDTPVYFCDQYSYSISVKGTRPKL